ncbi:helix-turn-helix transcriptional regulator [Patulibacter minatonensis]|uniref:helix-turn-helix transcriptional regulator n=1 Tax=Patulibacter minatonensis TaxID=298163 RepID=UPI000479D382|nr:helix-turn-helix transcriptional regulator [Patulibacter minatonensis]
MSTLDDTARMRTAGTCAWPYDIFHVAEVIDRVRRALESGRLDVRTTADELTTAVEAVAETFRNPAGDPRIERVALRQLREVTTLREHVRDRLVAARFRTQDRIDEALDQLALRKSAESAIDAAPRALCEACGFDSGLLSWVDGPAWFPRAAYSSGRVSAPHADRLAAFVGNGPVALSSTPVEASVIRRRAAALVPDDARARGSGVTDGVVSRRAHVIAPLVGPTGVFGLLHADALAWSQPPDEDDRDALDAFGAGFAIVLERLLGSERLKRRRHNISDAYTRALRSAEEVPELDVASGSGDLADPALRLTRLTPRQLEVLELLATGATNAVVRERLVIADSTIATHVKQILKKLEVSNRTSAVSVYLHAVRRGQLR